MTKSWLALGVKVAVVVWVVGDGPLSATTVPNRSVIWTRGRLLLVGPVAEQVTNLLATALNVCNNLLWRSAGAMHGLFEIRTPAELEAVNIPESNVVGAADVQVLG